MKTGSTVQQAQLRRKREEKLWMRDLATAEEARCCLNFQIFTAKIIANKMWLKVQQVYVTCFQGWT